MINRNVCNLNKTTVRIKQCAAWFGKQHEILKFSGAFEKLETLAFHYYV